MDDSPLLSLPHADEALVSALEKAGCSTLSHLSARLMGGAGGGGGRQAVVAAVERAVGAALAKEVLQVGQREREEERMGAWRWEQEGNRGASPSPPVLWYGLPGSSPRCPLLRSTTAPHPHPHPLPFCLPASGRRASAESDGAGGPAPLGPGAPNLQGRGAIRVYCLCPA